MADSTYAANIVTDPQTLLGLKRAVSEQLAPQIGLRGPDASRLLEQLRPLFIDTHQGLLVFGTPDEAVRLRANLIARAALEEALEQIFEERVRVELVLFNEAESSLPALIADFTEKRGSVEAGLRPASTEPPVEAGDEASGFDKVQLGLIQNNLRSVFTSPKRVVVVPGYLLRWIPYLGPLRTSIVVACFQAFYLSNKTTARANLTFEAPGPFLAAVAGIAESSIWRHLDDRELGWFLKRVPYKPDEQQWIRAEESGLTKKRPTRFLFRATSPLTPGDAQTLNAYLQDLNIQENPVAVLTELVRGEYRVEPRDVFPFPAPPPSKDWQQGDPQACLIHNIIFAAIGITAKNASKDLIDLVDELVERLLPANDQVHLSWYFLLHWQPLLGHGPGWATILLRDRCFYNRQTGELRDTVNVRDGYRELANALGLQRIKTVREWFPAPHAQKDEVKSADLSSRETLMKISQSKRSFVKEYAAKFVEIIEADADGRGRVSAFKARLKLFDPLTPTHEAIYNSLFPLAQRYFCLPQEQKLAFMSAFAETASMETSSVEWLIQSCNQAVGEILQIYGAPLRSGKPWTPDEAITADFLGAIERIINSYSGAIRRITTDNLGAIENFYPADLGAFEDITPLDSGAFERLTALLLGAIERITDGDPGAFERIGLVFWAHMRGLKYLVLNNHLDESLREYFLNTDLENTQILTSTTTNSGEIWSAGDEDDQEIESWDLNKLLDNFSPHIKQELLEKGVTVEAVVSCLLYLASSKGDNLGLGYVVEKLKTRPRDGQGGIYWRLAENTPQEIIARLHSFLENRNFQNREWRVAMGTPVTEKILELLEHLGLDSSQFDNYSY